LNEYFYEYTQTISRQVHLLNISKNSIRLQRESFLHFKTFTDYHSLQNFNRIIIAEQNQEQIGLKLELNITIIIRFNMSSNQSQHHGVILAISKITITFQALVFYSANCILFEPTKKILQRHVNTSSSFLCADLHARSWVVEDIVSEN
jgi:hypothetical protein